MNGTLDSTIPYDEKIYVFLAEIPKAVAGPPLGCKDREREIAACKSDTVQAQKYYVWRLLEQALAELKISLLSCDFQKLPSGKWAAKGVSFSLSHSENIAAVALAKGGVSVGIDVEKISAKTVKKLQNLPFLTAEESVEYADLQGDAQAEFLVSAWTKKESLFKMDGRGVFRPANISSKTPNVRTEWLEIVGERFALSVACETGVEGKIIIEKRSV